MAEEHIEKPREEDDIEIEFDDEACECADPEDLSVVEDAIVEVAFGDPGDDAENSLRTISWVDSFTPGLLKKQVADLLMADGDVHIILDNMAVTVPMMELFRLLEKVQFFKDAERSP